MRHVVRPTGIRGTPSAVAETLGWQTRFYPNPERPRSFDYKEDFFMAPVAPGHVTNQPEGYQDAYDFFTRNKLGQRIRLRDAGIPVPETVGSRSQAAGLAPGRFVVRPLRHSRSQHYRITDSTLDFIEGTEYLSRVYPKKREYRVIFVFGRPLIWLRKKQNEGVGPEEPWGHVNSSFQTINDVAASPLSRTDCVARLSDFAPVKNSHICAADILFNREETQPYVVLELNLCPALDIEGNRDKVLDAIRTRHTPVVAAPAPAPAPAPTPAPEPVSPTPPVIRTVPWRGLVFTLTDVEIDELVSLLHASKG